MKFPKRLLFRTAVTCPRISDIAIGQQPSAFVDIDPLPALCELEGEQPFATVKIACSEAGFYVALFIGREEPITVSRQRPHSADSLQVWLDTRGGTSGHRATRFCYHFVCLGRGGGPDRSEPIAREEQIRRGARKPDLAEEGSIPITAEETDDAYRIETHFPADILQGFDPDPGQRMRFNCLVTDYVHGRQNYCCNEQFPYTYDPSTWAEIIIGEE